MHSSRRSLDLGAHCIGGVRRPHFANHLRQRHARARPKRAAAESAAIPRTKARPCPVPAPVPGPEPAPPVVGRPEGTPGSVNSASDIGLNGTLISTGGGSFSSGDQVVWGRNEIGFFLLLDRALRIGAGFESPPPPPPHPTGSRQEDNLRHVGRVDELGFQDLLSNIRNRISASAMWPRSRDRPTDDCRPSNPNCSSSGRSSSRLERTRGRGFFLHGLCIAF